MITKQFLLFVGRNHYPNGGMQDFRASYDTLRQALQEVRDGKFNPPHSPYDDDEIAPIHNETERGDLWWHVYDVKLGGMVAGSHDGPFHGTDGGVNGSVKSRPEETEPRQPRSTAAPRRVSKA